MAAIKFEINPSKTLRFEWGGFWLQSTSQRSKWRDVIYPMPEISDFQRTNSEFAKSEQKYPVKITLEYEH
jgi:hypothetical protein